MVVYPLTNKVLGIFKKTLVDNNFILRLNCNDVISFYFRKFFWSDDGFGVVGDQGKHTIALGNKGGFMTFF